MGKTRVYKQKKEDILKEKELVEEKIAKAVSVKLKKKKITEVHFYIKCTYNNTIMTLTDTQGNALFWASAGYLGFKGTKKGTPFAAQKVAEVMSAVIKKIGIQKVSVFIKGVGPGRDTALKTLAQKGVEVFYIKDVTPIPHNGPRPPKRRRV